MIDIADSISQVDKVGVVPEVDRIDRLNDLAFKLVFGSPDNSDITISFLNSIMGLHGDKAISHLQFVDREITAETLDYRGARLDVLVTTGDGEYINVEVQIADQHDMEKRSLFYWSRLFSGQLHSGEPFAILRRTVTINILGFILYNDSPQLHWTFVPTDSR